MSLTVEIADLLADPQVLSIHRSPYGYLNVRVTVDHPIWDEPEDDGD